MPDSTLLIDIAEITVPATTDLLYLVADPTGTPLDRKVTIANLNAVLDHGALTGLTDDDHTQYLLASGTRAMTGNVTITKQDPSIIFNAGQSGDTKFWIGVQDDNGSDDDDVFQIGKGTTPGTTPYLTMDKDGHFGRATSPGKITPSNIDMASGRAVWHIQNLGSGDEGRAQFIVEGNNSTAGAIFEFINNTNNTNSKWLTLKNDADLGTWMAINDDGTLKYTILTMSMASSNIGVGSSAPGGGSTVGTAVLSLANGTAPVGGVANQVSIYSADVAASAELFALDEAGNTPQLSPHPSDKLNDLPVEATGPYAYPWAYSASNAYLGKTIYVDMAGVVKAVEQLTGKTFTFVEDLPPEKRADWDAGQETQRARRQEEIDRAEAQRAEMDTQIAAEKNTAKKAELQKQRDEIKMPSVYQKKRPPEWMVKRGVVTRLAA